MVLPSAILSDGGGVILPAGEIGLFAGSGGSGKSRLSLQVAVAAASADGQAALRGAADAFTDKGKADKARAVAEVAMLAGVVAQMGALAGRVAQPSSTLAEEIRLGLELEGLSIPAVVEMLQTTPAGGGGTALAVLHALLPRGANTRRDPILPRIIIAAPDLARERGELIVAPEGRAGLDR